MKKNGIGEKPHLKKKKHQVLFGSWVDPPGQPGRCTGRSFDKPRPVQPPGRSSPGSTRRAGLGLITMLI
jgi:hypothetical protein